jgi:hypothetical protein
MIVIIFILVLIIKTLDMITTFIAIKKYGLSEGNPIVDSLVTHVGLVPGLLILYVPWIAISVLLLKLGQLVILAICGAILVPAVINNIVQIVLASKEKR